MEKLLHNINRRQFLKTLGGSAATFAAATTLGAKNPFSEEDGEQGEMTYRSSGKGDRVSLLGYGCMRWPMTKNEKGEDIIDQEAVNQLVDYALAHGVNYFDTAPRYLQGRSEEATATALQRHPRNSYFIATKMTNTNDYSRKAALEMYHQSFKRLKVDYIDYYLLHTIGGTRRDLTAQEVFDKRFIENGMLDFLMKEREAGRIRHLGFSFHGQDDGFDYFLSYHEKVHWDFVQIQMNYVDWKHHSDSKNRRPQSDASYMYERLTELGIPVVIMEPLLGGQLASLNDHMTTEMLTREPSRSVASWAFRYCGTYPNVMTVLSGMTYMENLVDNLNSFAPLKPLTPEEVSWLENEVAEEFESFPIIMCTACQYCMPCPYGLDIPGIFAHYNKCVNEGAVNREKGTKEYRKARRKFLVGYDRSIDRLRQADKCIGCGHCTPHCPQGIRIPARMREIDEYTELLRSDISPL